MARFISNSFSISMVSNLASVEPVKLEVEEVDIERAKDFLSAGFVSAIGHAATSAFVSRLLGVDIPFNRISISLEKDSELLVVQILRRLEEGVVLSEQELLEVPIKFYLVKVL